MSEKGKDGTTPPPFTLNTTGTFSVGVAPAGQGDLSTNEVTTKTANLSLAPKSNAEDDDEFPAAIINRLVGLKQLQEQYDELEETYKAERVALEKKYFDLRAPLLAKRADVVTGKVDVAVETDDNTTTPESTSDVKGIPGFWLQAIANHPSLSELLGEQDGPALEALTDITLEYAEEYTGFKLSFHFAPNEYFTNEVLTKSYTVSPDLLDDTAPALTSVDGTTINWKDKKNLCQTETKKKQKSKKGGQTRYITQISPVRSFFHYFGEPHMGDDEEEEEEDEEGGESQKAHPFQLSVDSDYEVGHTFRSEIIPAAVLWFTGEADGGIDLGDEEDDEEGDEEDDDEDDEDPAEESEEVGDNPNKVSKGGAGPAGEQPECKQS